MDVFPKVTLILPIHNEAKYIQNCLDGLYRQNYPHDKMEIIIADGLSSDNTRVVVEGRFNPGIDLLWIENPGKIVPTGLNLAIQRAKGDIIIRVDGHTSITPDYVRQCVEALKRSGADNVGGRLDGRGERRIGEAVAIATSSPFGIGNARFHYSEQEEWVDTVYMGAWPRRVFKQIGLFDEELVRDQDDEFNYRLRESGGKILLSPKIKSIYMVRNNYKSLWKQYYQYGFWKVRVLQKHSRQMSLRQFMPPAFAGALLVSLLCTAIFPSGWVTFALVGGSYLLANIVASITIVTKKGWRHLALLPLTFVILHLSYGFGFLNGLIKFWNRWGDKKGKVPGYQLDEV